MDFNNINSISTSINPLIKSINQNSSQGGGDFEKMLESVRNEKDSAKLKKACRDLEGVFVSMMFKQMNSSVQKSGLIDEGYAGGLYREMLSEKYAEEAVKGEGMGIAKMLFKQLSAKSEVENAK